MVGTGAGAHCIPAVRGESRVWRREGVDGGRSGDEFAAESEGYEGRIPPMRTLYVQANMYPPPRLAVSDAIGDI